MILAKWRNVRLWSNPTSNIGDRPFNRFIFSRMFPKLDVDSEYYEDDGSPRVLIIGSGATLDKLSHTEPKVFFEAAPGVTSGPEPTRIYFGSGISGDFDPASGRRVYSPPGSIIAGLRGVASMNAFVAGTEMINPNVFGSLAVLLPVYVSNDVTPRRDVAHVGHWRSQANRHTVDYFRAELVTEFSFLDFIRTLLKYRRIETSSFTVAVIADAYGIPWKSDVWDSRHVEHFGRLRDDTINPNDFTRSSPLAVRRMQDDYERARQYVTNLIDANEGKG